VCSVCKERYSGEVSLLGTYAHQKCCKRMSLCVLDLEVKKGMSPNLKHQDKVPIQTNSMGAKAHFHLPPRFFHLLPLIPSLNQIVSTHGEETAAILQVSAPAAASSHDRRIAGIKGTQKARSCTTRERAATRAAGSTSEVVAASARRIRTSTSKKPPPHCRTTCFPSPGEACKRTCGSSPTARCPHRRLYGEC